MLRESAITWEQYTDMILYSLPPIYKQDLIYDGPERQLLGFEVVEMHVIDRALRQFGFTQHIPDPVSKLAHIYRNKNTSI